ncbi:hypothetical protein Sango_2962300 [Sesamum angolense]|uniref:Reverse transcriptase domain-containing protein n=1 Tax=Sesamum angolense TaxID=2727404 RepID=A0AAE1T5B8_9LAMI|nr:hypothetical protein Sango_2962300 [Sesamum angolense]
MKEVTDEFVSYFKTLLGGPRMQRNINLDFLRQHLKRSLSSDEADTICAPVTLAEIKDAAFDIAEDSAPGPDGYTAGFFKATWSVVGKEVSEVVSEFFRTGKLLKQVNATLLVLSPKVQIPSKVSDFRPISCCNVISKIITKIIVKRMQLVLHLLIDYSQNAFVPGRSISDNILLAQELLAGYNQAKLPPRCTIKVDIQKAYDSVDWDCLTASDIPSITVIKDTLCEFAELSGWNHLNLIFAGRVQLIRSVLNTLHSYWASVFILPKGIIKILEAKIRKFLWQGSTGRGYAKVAWEQICRPKEKGERYTNKVGDDSTFKLWQDIWHKQGPLCLSHPEGPHLTGLPLDALLSNVLQQGQWNWPAIPDAEFNEITSQLQPIHPNSPDEILWRHNSGKFSVQSAIELFQPRNNQVEWHGLLQGRYKIPRHSFILWLAILEKLSTMDKAWLSHGDNGCVLCDGHFMETHEHLFFNCQYTRRCLHLVHRQVRLQWPYSSRQYGIRWASRWWRSSHLANAAPRALLAALVYYV